MNVEQHNCDKRYSANSLGEYSPTVIREFFFQSHPNDERYFANFLSKSSVETDRGSKRQIVHLLLISRNLDFQ